MKKKKTALILSWWWMKASFTVWVLLWLAHQWVSSYIHPDIIIAGSGSAGTASYYLARQYDSIKNIRSNLLTTRQTINYLRINKIIDIDFIVDEVFGKLDPLNIAKVHTSPTQFYIPAFNRESGKVDFLYQDGSIDLMESLRATKAMPIAYKLNPKISVWDHTYCDSILSSQWRHHIQQAIELWATEIILISNTYPDTNTPIDIDLHLFNTRLRLTSPHTRDIYQKELEARKSFLVPEGIQLHTISPPQPLQIGSLDNHKWSIDRAIQIWMQAWSEYQLV